MHVAPSDGLDVRLPSPPPPSASDGGGEYDYHDGHELEPLVALVEGYCGASDRPPTLMLGSDSIPPEVLAGLRANGVCSLSVSTEREMRQARRMCRPLRGGAARCGPAATFGGACLRPRPPPSVLSDLPAPVRVGVGGGASSNRPRRPPAVDDSPVHMHCRLVSDVPLLTGEDGDEDVRADDSHPPPSMLLLQVDTYVIGGDVIWTRQQSSLAPGRTSIHGNPDLRDVAGKIDCLLLKPLASLGGGRFGRVGCIYHMGRPRPTPSKVDLNADTCGDVGWESESMWEIDRLVPVESIYNICFSSHGNGETIEYAYRLDPRCALGYNPMKQVVCPRFVGWISTYEPDSLLPPGDDDSDIDRTTTTLRRRRRTKTGPIPHISPYSFFVDVARGPRPMVAFAACPRSDEFGDSDDDDDDDITGNADDANDGHHHHHHHDGGARWKDAQRDAERTGYFCVNVVSDGLAWAMNASAAPLGRGLSEFRLAAGGGSPIRAGDEGAVLCENERIVPSPLPAPAVDAPFVSQSPSFMECRYVKTGKP